MFYQDNKRCTKRYHVWPNTKDKKKLLKKWQLSKLVYNAEYESITVPVNYIVNLFPLIRFLIIHFVAIHKSVLHKRQYRQTVNAYRFYLYLNAIIVQSADSFTYDGIFYFVKTSPASVQQDILSLSGRLIFTRFGNFMLNLHVGV